MRSASSLYLWVALPGVSDSLAFAKTMLAEQIVIAPGRVFRVDSAQTSPWARYNLAAVADPRFGKALKAIMKRGPSTRD